MCREGPVLLPTWYGPSSVSSVSCHAVAAPPQLPKCACVSPSSCMASTMEPFSLRRLSSSITWRDGEGGSNRYAGPRARTYESPCAPAVYDACVMDAQPRVQRAADAGTGSVLHCCPPDLGYVSYLLVLGRYTQEVRLAGLGGVGGGRPAGVGPKNPYGKCRLTDCVAAIGDRGKSPSNTRCT